MRLIKMFGLAAMVAAAAMAFVGATSVSAANTGLCTGHDAATALTCDSAAATGVSVNNSGQGVGTLLTPIVNVLCLNISGSASVLELANPQQVHLQSLTFANCGTTATHSNCDVTVLGDLPLTNLNKTGLDAGTLTGTDGEVLVHCKNIDLFFLDIHCIYDGNGLQLSAGGQHLDADETTVDKVAGELCPKTSALDGLLKTTANRYILA